MCGEIVLSAAIVQMIAKSPTINAKSVMCMCAQINVMMFIVLLTVSSVCVWNNEIRSLESIHVR